MPRITTHAISLELAKKASARIQERVASLLSVSSETVTFAVSQDVFLANGVEARTFPFVEIRLFERGREKEDAIAKIVTEELHEAGCPEVDIYLIHLQGRQYYENGAHL